MDVKMTLSGSKPSSFSVKDILDLPDAKSSVGGVGGVNSVAQRPAETAAVVLPLPAGKLMITFN